MAVAFDTAFEQGVAADASPFSFVSNAGTVAGSIGNNSNRVLIGIVGFDDSVTVSTAAGLTPVTMTWGGVSMTAIGAGLDTPGGFSVFLFGLIAPAIGAQTLNVAWSVDSNSLALGGISVYNADQTTGWQNATTNTGTSTSATIAVPFSTGNAVVVGRTDDNGSSAVIAAGTQDWDERSLNGNYGGAHNLSSGTVTWTLGSSVGWAMAGVEVIAASAGGVVSDLIGGQHFSLLRRW